MSSQEAQERAKIWVASARGQYEAIHRRIGSKLYPTWWDAVPIVGSSPLVVARYWGATHAGNWCRHAPGS